MRSIPYPCVKVIDKNQEPMKLIFKTDIIGRIIHTRLPGLCSSGGNYYKPSADDFVYFVSLYDYCNKIV